MDIDPIDGSSAVASSIDSHSSREVEGAAAEFVTRLRARYRDGHPLRVNDQLATLLAGSTDNRRCRRRPSRRLAGSAAACAGAFTLIAALAGADALPAAAQDVVARVAESVGITLPSTTNEHVDDDVPRDVGSPAVDAARSTSLPQLERPGTTTASGGDPNGNGTSAGTGVHPADDLTTPGETAAPGDAPDVTPGQGQGTSPAPGQGQGQGTSPAPGQGQSQGTSPAGGQGAGPGQGVGHSQGRGADNADGTRAHPENDVERGPS